MRWKNISAFKKHCENKGDNYSKFEIWSKDKQINLWQEINHFNTNLNKINKCLSSKKLKSIPPCQDHITMFKSLATDNVYYTFQPYCNIQHIEEQMKQWNIENNVDYQIFTNNYGWHNEKETILVVITF